jgi:hypothetical protein
MKDGSVFGSNMGSQSEDLLRRIQAASQADTLAHNSLKKQQRWLEASEDVVDLSFSEDDMCNL